VKTLGPFGRAPAPPKTAMALYPLKESNFKNRVVAVLVKRFVN
jgi:hypothetical protein